MRITDLLKKSGIALGVKVADKSEAIDKLVSLHEKCGNLKDVKAYKEGILNREELGTTAVGMEVAIPHAKSEAVKAPALTAITVPDGVDYDSPDGKPCKLLFMIAATTDGDVHLEVLARLMQLLMHEDFTAKLKAAKLRKNSSRLLTQEKQKSSPMNQRQKFLQRRVTEFLLSQPVQQVLLILIWRLNHSRKPATALTFRLRLKQTVRAVQRMCLLKKKLQIVTVSSLPLTSQ